jgi:hypothetical protein
VKLEEVSLRRYLGFSLLSNHFLILLMLNSFGCLSRLQDGDYAQLAHLFPLENVEIELKRLKVNGIQV